jgi:hypothetical protein
MPTTANSLQGFLAVFAQESLEQFIAGMPNINLFTKNFDNSVANGGISVTTRIPTTVWGSPNDLSTDGWAGTAASASAITATLKERAYDMAFSELEFATITPQMLSNLYLPAMAKQLANGIVVDAINNITSSYFTNTLTVASSSLFTVTGSTSLQKAATTLSNLEVPEEGRYAIVTPNVFESLTAGVLPTYIYGNPNAVQSNNPQKLLNFDLIKYPRLYNATKPNGGASYGNSDKLIGFAGNASGLVCAVRAPLDVNNGLVQSATATDATSGLSLQTRLVYDVSKPCYRLAVVSIFGTAQGNKNAIVPILTSSV